MLRPGTIRQREVVATLGSWAANQACGDRLRCQKVGIVEADALRKPVGPSKQCRLAATSDQHGVMFGEQLGDSTLVTRRGRLLNGIADQTAFTKPLSGTRPKGPRCPRIRESELQLQELCEEVVVAVPLPPCIERDQEQVGVLDLSQHPRRVAPPQNIVAERCFESAEDGGSQQELPLPEIERVKHLAGQVVGDVAMVAGKLAHPRPRIL